MEENTKIEPPQQNADRIDYEKIGTVTNILPFTGLRGNIAKRMVMSVNNSAQYTITLDADVTEIQKIRRHLSKDIRKVYGVGIRFVDVIALAVSNALKMHPNLNAIVVGEEARQIKEVHLGMAVAIEQGVLVPVIRNAENLTFRGIESEVKRLAIRAREGEITVDEMTGGTFTITNGGVFGSMLSTPIINPPQSGILGMHNIVERAIVRDGAIAIAPVMYVALSYDHRIIDGKESVGFLVAVKEALESPEELLMDGNVKKALEL